MYPSHLTKDESRVPLHRRGTSRTYERLEDLLREAGYKETRVFTPETERLEAEAEERKKRERERRTSGSGNLKAMGSMVNFLSHLVPWGDDGSTDALDFERNQRMKKENVLNYQAPSWDMPTPTPKSRNSQRRPHVALSARQRSTDASTLASTSSHSPPPRPKSAMDARSALRHMISAPDIPQRRQPLARRSSETPRRPYHHSERRDEPPLPSNWLQSVTQAVLGAGQSSGAYVGGPSTRKRGLQVEISGSRRVFTPYTPIRADKTSVAVSHTVVVCRSAPGSRSSSVARPKRSKDKEPMPACRVPSLGVTSVEGESWPMNFEPGIVPSARSAPAIVLDESDDELGGGELDFARLLVPARRQHSIQSLRRHLHNPVLVRPLSSGNLRRAGSASGSLRRVIRRGSETPDDYLEERLEEDFRRSRRGSIDEAGDGLGEWAAHGLPGLEQAVTRKRRAMPWTTWTQGRP